MGKPRSAEPLYTHTHAPNMRSFFCSHLASFRVPGVVFAAPWEEANAIDVGGVPGVASGAFGNVSVRLAEVAGA